MSATYRVLRIAGAVFLLCVVGLVGFVALVPTLSGGTMRTVLTGSMSPAIRTGSVVLTRPVDPAMLRPGDVATYRKAGGSLDELVTHRIVRVEGAGGRRSFVFQGDANTTPDPVVIPASAVVGKVWFSVPYLGSLRSRFASEHALLTWIGVIGLGSFAVFQLVGGLREHRAAT